MILEQPTDQLDPRSLKRKPSFSRRSLQRAFTARVRKTRSQFLTWQRRQYFLTDAHTDVRRALHLNEDIALGVLITAFVLGYAFAVVAAQTMFTFFESTFALSDVSGVNFMIVLGIAAGILGTTLFWLSAFIANSLSIALMHGLTRKQNRSLRSTLRQGLRYASRTTVTWGLVLGSVAAPLAIAGALSLLIMLAGNFLTTDGKVFAAGLISLMGLILGGYNLLRYGLASQVAVFEPQLPFADVLRASHQLMAKVGRPFIAALLISYGLVLSIAYALCSLISHFLHLSAAISFSIVVLSSLLYLNSLLTVLYRKRRLSRR